jgi:hypothetical protein
LHIISRNLTPDASGKPEGHTLGEFLTIMRTGVDMDQRHPNWGTEQQLHVVSL